jgi:hypothetical protein
MTSLIIFMWRCLQKKPVEEVSSMDVRSVFGGILASFDVDSFGHGHNTKTGSFKWDC